MAIDQTAISEQAPVKAYARTAPSIR